MTRLLWCTDIHLNFLPHPDGARYFGQYLTRERDFDAVVVTGDIAEAPNVAHLLQLFAEGIGPERPIYFIEGNHDYYRGSFKKTRATLNQAQATAPSLKWLDGATPVLLDDQTALVGQYAWYDAMHGDSHKSPVVMSDFQVVEDLRKHYFNHSWAHEAHQGSRHPLLATLRAQVKDAVGAAEPQLRAALAERPLVIFATHIPPFPGACWHEGKLSDAHWMPWFTCDAMGKMLERVAAEHPERRILVLCGHTHSSGVYEHAPNLRVLTGRALYGAPDVAAVLDTPLDDWADIKLL